MKPWKSDIEAARELHDEWVFADREHAVPEIAKELAPHMQPQRELIRQLSEWPCYNHCTGGCGDKCLPCRARKLIKEQEEI